jgi:hypothetical protein
VTGDAAMPALISIVGILAAAAWVVAVSSGLNLVSMAPAGGRIATLWDLGWWRFASIEQRIGSGARKHIDRYMKAFIAFFLCIVAGAVGGVAATFIDAPAR